MGTKGLKQSVAEAMGDTTPEQEALPPVEVSGEALRALTTKVREWTGVKDASLVLGQPPTGRSPWAMWQPGLKTLTANADALVLNPNRVLLTVTPFRLRQEAVLTGAMLHEAGHARYSLWKPEGVPVLHSDGTTPTRQTVGLAMLMEEARVEGLMARDAKRVGADGLDWTMRASAAHLLPMTALHLSDPAQQVMDLISSWTLRAGRQIALDGWLNNYRAPSWVHEFTSLLHQMLVVHFTNLAASADVDDEDDPLDDLDPASDSRRVLALLESMVVCEDNDGPTMLDTARTVLDMLFPETDGDDEGAPMPGLGCEAQPQPEDESDEQDSGEGEAQPEDDEPGDAPGEGDSDDEGDAEGDADGGSDDADDADGGDDADSDQGDGDSDGDGGSDDAESDDAESDDSDSDEGATSSTDDEAGGDLAKALAEMEAKAKAQTDEDSDESEAQAQAGGSGAGSGGQGNLGGGFRNPTKTERETGKHAERFLRDLIDPSETSKVMLTESPSATVDGAALAAWRASGQVRDPKFFKRTRREVQPSPPVKIAVLADVSGSMDVLQKPTALLSWALASAALDLRNFAGRGQQIESTLIHWGSTARVIQRSGEPLPGIKEFDCSEGTYAMGSALALVEQEIPGFFDAGDRPENRLLVQFTDWDLYGDNGSTPYLSRALEAGVNMISVVPPSYSPRYSALDSIMAKCKIQRGRHHLFKYNPMFPDQVWSEAAKMLA